MSTLTYVYDDSTAVLGPLSRTSEPHAYDLCAEHARRLTAPQGWQLIRVPGSAGASDDLVALADAVDPRRRPAADPAPTPAPAAPPAPGASPGSRHLHVIRSTHD